MKQLFCIFQQLRVKVIFSWSYRSTLKRLCLSTGMQLYKTINSIKIIFLGFWTMLQNSYHVKKVLTYTYFVFCILCNAFQRMLIVNTNKKIMNVPDFSSWVLQLQFDKAKSEDEIFLVIKTIGLIWDTFLNLCV